LWIVDFFDDDDDDDRGVSGSGRVCLSVCLKGGGRDMVLEEEGEGEEREEERGVVKTPWN
jgi:hypothetical protein